MHIVFLIIILLLLFWLPQWWAKRIFKHYAKPRSHIPGSGGELARHLLDRFGMSNVKVEVTDEHNDHYDPNSRTVRLSPTNHDERSLTAVAVAAHEVGHAIQHQENDARLLWRTRLVILAQGAEKVGVSAMVIMPVVMLFSKNPVLGGLMIGIGLLSMISAALVHLITLPVELDASFGKALPVLRKGQYVSEQDEQAVRQILKAAAYTYVAASLSSLLNIGRWLVILRR